MLMHTHYWTPKDMHSQADADTWDGSVFLLHLFKMAIMKSEPGLLHFPGEGRGH